MNNDEKLNPSGGGVPTFTPPAQTFAPPAYSGPVCYYHKDEPAVAQCARCGKYICQDCFDNYQVTDGEYAGQALCYDCCQQLVSENVAELKKQKGKITALFVATIIGMLIGLGVGADGGAGAAFFCMLWFGSFWTWVKSTLSGWWNAPGGPSVAGFIGAGIGGLIIAPIKTIQKVIQCITYLTRTSKFIESDSEALRQMQDYMEYTMIRNQNRGVDIATLLAQDSKLADNSYAHMVRDRGEEGAEAALRDCVASINENGEIIRDFAA